LVFGLGSLRPVQRSGTEVWLPFGEVRVVNSSWTEVLPPLSPKPCV